jgi:hypothetical protein
MQGNTTTIRGTTTISSGGTGTTFTVTSVTGMTTGDAIIIGARIPIYYLSTPTVWRKLSTTDFLAVMSGAAATASNIASGVCQYNNAVAGGFTDVTSGRYFPIYIIATNSILEPIVAILGQGQSVNTILSSALSESSFQFNNLLSLTTLGLQEICPIYRLTYQYSSAAGFNQNRARLSDATFLNIRVSTVSGSVLGSSITSLSGSQIYLDTTNFDGILSVSNTTSQSAFDTIDDYCKTSNFKILDSSDITKIAKFDLSGLSVGTSTYILPDGSDTIVTLIASQLLTNKTLTAPKITSGSHIADANGNEIIIFPITIASAVNEITITNAATGNSPIISASGSEVDISGDPIDVSLKIHGQVNGKVMLGNADLQFPNVDGSAGEVLSTDGSGVLSWIAQSAGTPAGNNTEIQYNSTGNFGASSDLTYGSNILYINGNIKLGTASARSIQDANGNEIIKFATTVSSAINEVTITNAASGDSPIISATGTGVDISGDPLDISLKIVGKGNGNVLLGNAFLKFPNADGNANDFLQTDGAGNLSWAAHTATPPAGSDTQIQYNSGGSAFGASSDLSWTANQLYVNGNIKFGTASSRSIVDSNTIPIINFPTTVGSAQNYITITNAIDNANPIISAAGETDVGLNITGAGLGNIVLTSTGTTISAITLVANTTTGGIDINAGTGGIDIDSGGIISITSTNTTAGAIEITATTTTGGIDINAGSGGINISTLTTGHIVLTSSDTSANAIHLSAIESGGGIDIDAGSGGINIGTVGSLDISSLALLSIVSTNTTATAISLTASTGAGGITLTAGTGGTVIDEVQHAYYNLLSSCTRSTADLPIDWALSNLFVYTMETTDITTVTMDHAKKGSILLKVIHIATPQTITFQGSAGYYHVGQTGDGAKTYTLAAGATMITIFNIFYDGSKYFINENPYHA